MAYRTVVPTLPIVGRVKLGREENGQSKKLDHFLMTGMAKIGTKGNKNFQPRLGLMASLADKAEKGAERGVLITNEKNIIGLPIRFPFNDPDANCQVAYSSRPTKTGLTFCKGNGEKAWRNGKEIQCPCKRLEDTYIDKDKCKVNLRLTFTIDGTSDFLGSFYIFHSSSIHSANRLKGSLNYYHNLTEGNLAFLPLYLCVQPITVPTPGGMFQTHNIVSLNYKGSLEDLQNDVLLVVQRHGKFIASLKEQEAVAKKQPVTLADEDEDFTAEFYPGEESAESVTKNAPQNVAAQKNGNGYKATSVDDLPDAPPASAAKTPKPAPPVSAPAVHPEPEPVKAEPVEAQEPEPAETGHYIEQESIKKTFNQQQDTPPATHASAYKIGDTLFYKVGPAEDAPVVKMEIVSFPDDEHASLMIREAFESGGRAFKDGQLSTRPVLISDLLTKRPEKTATPVETEQKPETAPKQEETPAPAPAPVDQKEFANIRTDAGIRRWLSINKARFELTAADVMGELVKKYLSLTADSEKAVHAAIKPYLPPVTETSEPQNKAAPEKTEPKPEPSWTGSPDDEIGLDPERTAMKRIMAEIRGSNLQSEGVKIAMRSYETGNNGNKTKPFDVPSRKNIRLKDVSTFIQFIHEVLTPRQAIWELMQGTSGLTEVVLDKLTGKTPKRLEHFYEIGENNLRYIKQNLSDWKAEVLKKECSNDNGGQATEQQEIPPPEVSHSQEQGQDQMPF